MDNSKQIQLGVVMDPIHAIHPEKDTTLALLYAAQQRGWQLFYMEQKDLFIRDGVAYATMQPLVVFEHSQEWFQCEEAVVRPLHTLDVISMRKDPPFDMAYIYSTYILELAEAHGVLVINRPQSLRDANEKVFTSWFPECICPNLISADYHLLKQFITEQKDVVLKPLHSMGGGSIFRVKHHDDNVNVILETLTEKQTLPIMAQRFLPEIREGDKRIFLIDGEPIPYALARIPPKGDIRGNLAAGGRGIGVEINERDRWICAQIGPKLREKGLWFVGIDVIGDYLTEINVTSPTCLREIEKAFPEASIAQRWLDFIETRL